MPYFYQNSKVVTNLVGIDADELEDIYTEVQNVLNQRFIKTADTSLDRWGAEMNIDLSPYIEDQLSIEQRTYDFAGKISGSTLENPNRMLYRTANANLFESPSTNTSEVTQGNYDSGSKQDGSLLSSTMTTSGQYAQRLFEFDFSYLGLTLSQMKNQLRALTFSISGYGSGNNGGVSANGLTVKWWNPTTGAWDDLGSVITGGTITTYSNDSSILGDRLTNNQKVYVLVHATYPASSTIPSVVNIDYVKLDVEYEWHTYITYARSYDEKRALLMLQLRSLGTVTKTLLSDMCSIYGGGEVDILEDNPNHIITIKFMSIYGMPLKVRDLTISLRNIIPSHLDFKYQYRYMTFSDIDGEKEQWVTIDSKSLLWSEVDNGGLG
jgi:hypothetical protein